MEININLDKINQLLNLDLENNFKVTREDKFKLSTGPSSSKPICKRQLYFDIRNYLPKKEYIYQKMNIFEMGSQLEKLITKRLTEYGFVLSHIIEEQQEFNFFPGLKGFADGIIENIENTFLIKYFPKNTRMLLEMKTSKDKNFKELQIKKLKNAKIQHFAQMQSYLYAMSSMEEYKDIEYGLYVCLDKDNSNFYFEIIKRDLEFGKNNIDELKSIIYSSTIPHKTRIFCNWCDYKNICDIVPNDKFKICNKCNFCNRDINTGNIICEKDKQDCFNITSEERTSCPEFKYPDEEKLKINNKNDNNINKKTIELLNFFNSL